MNCGITYERWLQSLLLLLPNLIININIKRNDAEVDAPDGKGTDPTQ